MAKIGTKPNGIHYLDVHVEVDGQLKRQRVSTDTRDPKEADRQLRAWIAGVHPKHPSMGGAVAPKGRIGALLTSSNPKVRVTGWTMGRLFDRCAKDVEVWGRSKSQATIRSNIKLLDARMGDWLVTEVTEEKLQELVDEMREEGYQPASIKRKLDMVSKALRMATKWKEDGKPLLLTKPQMPPITVENTKDRVLKADEETLVFAAIDARIQKEPARQWTRFKMLIRVLLDTGFRRGEALILGPESVESLRKGGEEYLFLALPRWLTKNKKPRLVPCTAAVIELIPALNAQAVGGRWFPMDSTAWYMWDNIRADVKAMGGNIDDVGIHTLRHTCITRLAKGGMELQRLSMWAGHSSVLITAKRYAHLDATSLLDGIDALGTVPAISGKRDANPELPVHSISSISGGNRADTGTARLQ